MAGRPSRSQRIPTLVFLFVFFVFGFSGWEQWPLTSWHLFSAIRTRTVEVWHATTIDAGGVETPIPFKSFGVRYAGWYSRLITYHRLPPAAQLAECRAWSQEVQARSRSVVAAVVIYRGIEDRGARMGDRAAPPVLTPAFRCSADRVETL
jgi:hypothetical protein